MRAVARAMGAWHHVMTPVVASRYAPGVAMRRHGHRIIASPAMGRGNRTRGACGPAQAEPGDMLVHKGASRSIGTDLRLGCTLAAVAAAVNVSGFMVTGYYCANMTGNLSAMAIDMVTTERDVLPFVGVICVFVLGSIAATLLASAGNRRGIPAIHARAILLEGMLLAALGVVPMLMPPGRGAGLLAYGMGFLMGFQNATVTHLSGARVRTTHMTGMLTDLGMELALWFDHRRTGNRWEGATNVRERLRLHGAIILSFGLGGIAGMVLEARYGTADLLLMGGLLVALALPAVVRGTRQGA